MLKGKHIATVSKIWDKLYMNGSRLKNLFSDYINGSGVISITKKDIKEFENKLSGKDKEDFIAFPNETKINIVKKEREKIKQQESMIDLIDFLLAKYYLFSDELNKLIEDSEGLEKGTLDEMDLDKCIITVKDFLMENIGFFTSVANMKQK